MFSEEITFVWERRQLQTENRLFCTVKCSVVMFVDIQPIDILLLKLFGNGPMTGRTVNDLPQPTDKCEHIFGWCEIYLFDKIKIKTTTWQEEDDDDDNDEKCSQMIATAKHEKRNETERQMTNDECSGDKLRNEIDRHEWNCNAEVKREKKRCEFLILKW